MRACCNGDTLKPKCLVRGPGRVTAIFWPTCEAALYQDRRTGGAYERHYGRGAVLVDGRPGYRNCSRGRSADELARQRPRAKVDSGTGAPIARLTRPWRL